MQRIYTVAGLSFRLVTSSENLPHHMIDAYTPFSESKERNELLFDLQIIKGFTTKTGISPFIDINQDSERITVFKNKDEYEFHFYLGQRSAPCGILKTKNDFQTSTLIINGEPHECSFAFNNGIMLLYAITAAEKEALLIHASVIKRNELGYLFLGKSGTGKSTHSRLWMKNLDGCELLNDDNPVIRILNKKAIVFGSPWSGKTPCFKNKRAPIGAFVELEQGPNNQIERLHSLSAYTTIMSSCSCAILRKETAQSICNSVRDIIRMTKTFHMSCRPDREAATMCAERITP